MEKNEITNDLENELDRIEGNEDEKPVFSGKSTDNPSSQFDSSWLENIIVKKLLTLPEAISFNVVAKDCSEDEKKLIKPLFESSKEDLESREKLAKIVYKKYMPNSLGGITPEVALLLSCTVTPIFAIFQAKSTINDFRSQKHRGEKNEKGTDLGLFKN